MWFIYALVAMLCFGCMQLLFKQLSQTLGAGVILVFLFAFSFLFYLAHVAVTRPPVPVNARLLALIVVASAFSYAGNLLMVKSLAIAPNPGYAISVVGLQALVVTIAAIFLFGASLSWMKVLGVVFAVAGVALLAMDN